MDDELGIQDAKGDMSVTYSRKGIGDWISGPGKGFEFHGILKKTRPWLWTAEKLTFPQGSCGTQHHRFRRGQAERRKIPLATRNQWDLLKL